MKKISSTSMRQWLQDQLDAKQLKDLAEHGAASGTTPGLITYGQTTRLYDEFEEEIWLILETSAAVAGYVSIPAFIATLNGAKHVVCSFVLSLSKGAHFKNLCVWFVAEEYAKSLTDPDQQPAH
jgi:hypothetical protein